jgi:hypothetical protein
MSMSVMVSIQKQWKHKGRLVVLVLPSSSEALSLAQFGVSVMCRVQ